MKIKLYIVSYIDFNALNRNLKTIFESDLLKYNFEINIISNHSSFSFNYIQDFFGKVNVIRNHLRPDFSTGHLSRNWNEAIINGFKDLNHPDCDILIHVQDDTLFEPDFMSKLIHYHNTYNFITAGTGDNVCSYTVDAVKHIGLWDERFCNIFYQEGDYFLRALMHNKSKSSINDWPHKRELNPLVNNAAVNVSFPIARRTKGDANDYGLTPHGSAKYMSASRKIFELKYPNIHDINWPKSLIDNPPLKPSIPSFILYPYFEKNILNLEEKGFLTEFSDKWFI